MIYNIKAAFPYKEIYRKNAQAVVYGSRVDVINNGETELIAHGVRIFPQGFYTFQYAESYLINDSLEIKFPSDPENVNGKNECLILVYKPSKDLVKI